MESDAIEKILESVAAGKTTPAEALLSLKKEPFTDLGYAKVDHHRALRQNATEVIWPSRSHWLEPLSLALRYLARE